MRLLYEQVIIAEGASLKLVRVLDQMLPPTCGKQQPSASTSSPVPPKPHQILGWPDTADHHVLRRAVTWHLDHPPSNPDSGFSADDRIVQSNSAVSIHPVPDLGWCC
jgi:hypothetical protein